MNQDHQKLETLFNQALKFAPTERPAFLAGACGNDETLRKRLEELLAAEAAAGSFLPEAPDPGAPTILDTATAPQEAVGSQVNRYKLLEKLGEGGFGEVWLAEQKEPVRRKVALKIIKLGMDTRQVIARFEAERQALALMDHPNIAKVLDAGATAQGRPYFVMELVRGIPITRFCDESNMPTKGRLDLFIQVCQAVQHAHQKGIIHRDIKPSNILVTLHDGVPVPKVIDFGIAKATQGELTDKTIHTQFQQFIGTPAYVSPEQAEMTGLDIDTRSDIYSLGVLLYEILTGTTPFDARTLLAAGLDAMRRTIREQEPARPSTRLATLAGAELTTTAKRRGCEAPKLIHLLAGDLDWIVMKCLEKDRSRRYETANGLAADLKRHLTNEPVVARPPSAAYRFQKALRRNKLAFGAAFAVFAALLVGLSLATIGFVQARVQRNHALGAREAAENARANEAQQRQRAEANESSARQLLYDANMNLAQQAWETTSIGPLKQILDETKSHPNRGFEWYYWQAQVHQATRTLKGSVVGRSAQVTSAQFSPDGRRIIGMVGEGIITIWDAASGRELLEVNGRGNDAGSGSMWATFTPDGQRIMVTGYGVPVRFLDATTGQELSRLPGTPEKGRRASASYSPDGKRIVLCLGDGAARILDAATLQELLVIENPNSARRSFQNAAQAAFSADGQRIATWGGGSVPAKIWGATTGQELFTLGSETNSVTSLAFSPDGRRIVTRADVETVAILWDAATGRQLLTLQGHTAPINSVRFSPDSQRIITAGGRDGYSDATVRVWDVASGRELFKLVGHETTVQTASFSPDGRWIVTGGRDSIKVWDATISREPVALQGAESVNGAEFSPDARRLVTYDSRLGRASLWDVATGRELPAFSGYSNRVAAGTFAADGLQVATADTNDVVKFWDVATGWEVRTLNLPAGSIGRFVGFFALSPKGRHLAIGGNDHPRVAIWDAASGRNLFTLDAHPLGGRTQSNGQPTQAAVFSGVFSPDGQKLATGGTDFAVKVWDVATGRNLLTLEGHANPPSCLVFSPDGRWLVSGSFDGKIKVWDAATGRERFTLTGHSGILSTVRFSPDGRRLVTSSIDSTVRLWDADTGRELLTLKRNQGAVLEAAFSPDGQRILSCGFDRRISVWEAASQDQVAAWERSR